MHNPYCSFTRERETTSERAMNQQLMVVVAQEELGSAEMMEADSWTAPMVFIKLEHFI